MSQCKEDEGASKLPTPWSQAAKLGFWLQAGRCSTLWLQMVAQHREEPAQSRMAHCLVPLLYPLATQQPAKLWHYLGPPGRLFPFLSLCLCLLGDRLLPWSFLGFEFHQLGDLGKSL